MFSLVIVSYNSQDTIARCISSIPKKGLPQIIVVDNASQDKTAEAVRKKFPRVKLIKNPKNVGFTRACNQGAGASTGNFILFLNPDTEILSQNILSTLQSFILRNHSFGVIGFKFVNPDGSLQPSFGSFPTLLRIVADRIPHLNSTLRILIRDGGLFRKVRKVDWTSASGLLVKRDVFLKIGGFDEKIFMYGEDYELAFRLKKAGFQNYFLPWVKILHQDSGRTNPLRKPHKYFSMRKGFLYFFKKHNMDIDLFLLSNMIKVESFLMLATLAFRKGSTEEKNMWKKYLLETLKL